MKKIIIGVAFLFLIGSSAYSESIVFEGSPDITNSSSPEETFNMPMAGNDRLNYKCVIAKEGDDYVWLSREKVKLNHIKSGLFDYFVNPDGSGYVKITKMSDGKYQYMESMNMLFKIITYWGTADKFEP